MRLGLTEKFLAEGQPEVGKNGHVLAAVSHRRVPNCLPMKWLLLCNVWTTSWMQGGHGGDLLPASHTIS